ncbi:MAG: hypothetical protein RL154_1112 [Pseudomonadota bacterium]
MRIGQTLYQASLYTRVTPISKDKEKDSSEKEDKQSKASGDKQDTPEAKEQIAKLQTVDAQVRTHEAAHQAAGGGFAGGASFGYTKGPDGKQYAVSGEVPIDMSPETSPEATISKMDQVKAAALAPADPSPQDLKVASSAAIMAMKAKLELSQKQNEQGNDSTSKVKVEHKT